MRTPHVRHSVTQLHITDYLDITGDFVPLPFDFLDRDDEGWYQSGSNSLLFSTRGIYLAIVTATFAPVDADTYNIMLEVLDPGRFVSQATGRWVTSEISQFSLSVSCLVVVTEPPKTLYQDVSVTPVNTPGHQIETVNGAGSSFICTRLA